MPQSARATFKPVWRKHRVILSISFNASIGTSNLQARSSRKRAISLLGFQCLNRHEQPSSIVLAFTLEVIERFNASIGTSNLQARTAAFRTRNWWLVSMPQSARATFKLSGWHCLCCQSIVSMPQSARATFKRERLIVPEILVGDRFNASIGTSNLQAQIYIAQGRHPDGVSMPQSARATFKPAHKAIGNLVDLLVSMPQSARATFKRTLAAIHDCHVHCFNASIGTSNLQAGLLYVACVVLALFQCLNRHEQPSSLAAVIEDVAACYVSMPQSARATFKRGTSSETASARAVSMPQSARATFKLPISPVLRKRPKVSMPQSARATFKPLAVNPRLAPVNVSMPQSARATFKPGVQIGCRAGRLMFQCLNRHEQPSS